MTDKLQPNDPLNQLLGAYQLAFLELHGKLLAFLDEKLKQAHERALKGWLDVKLVVVGDKLIVRRAFRALDAKAPGGQWWTLPILPNVVGELLERIKPVPEETPARDSLHEVDATAPAEPEAPSRGLLSLVESRRRELTLLLARWKKTSESFVAAGVDFDAFTAERHLRALEAHLDAAEARVGTIQ